MIPWVHQSPNPKQHHDQFSRFFAKLTADSHAPFAEKLPLPRGTWTPSHTWFLGPTQIINPKVISISSAIFAQMTAEGPYTLQWAAPSLLKIASSHGGSGRRYNTWFLGPSRVLDPNDILISSADFAELTNVTDRQIKVLCQ